MSETGIIIGPGEFGAFLSQVQEWGGDVEQACEAALYAEAEAIIVDATPLVPWLNSILKGSHFVERVDATSVVFGYGGAAKAYAWVQHEHEEFEHPRGGEAKYLLTAVELHEANLDERLAEHAQSFME